MIGKKVVIVKMERQDTGMFCIGDIGEVIKEDIDGYVILFDRTGTKRYVYHWQVSHVDNVKPELANSELSAKMGNLEDRAAKMDILLKLQGDIIKLQNDAIKKLEGGDWK
jgi:hypothetical protein